MENSNYHWNLGPLRYLLATSAVLCLGLACTEEGERTRLYALSDSAPSLDVEQIKDLQHLGTEIIDRGVNFSVYSGNAERIDLLLFDDPEASLPTRRFEMKRMGDVYNLHVEGVGLGQHYGYIAWGPNWTYDEAWFPGSIHGFVADVDAAGHRFNPNKLLLDPYTRAIHRDHDWGVASTASGPARTESTFAAASKSVVVESKYVWTEGEAQWQQMRKTDAPGHRFEDLILYEAHPKGFTADPASGVEFPGTWRGLGEKAVYLKELGITAVELMPINEKPLDGGYWGYNSLLFFAAEQSFAATKRPEEVADEFKWMVDQMHQQGIEVIIDVVYNHTGEGGLWREKLEYSDTQLDPNIRSELINFDPKEVAGLYSYRGLDNVSYYALSEEDPGFYNNNTGVGNTLRNNYRPLRQLVMDSLHYWVNEMHVDGFRFDLAPVLADKDKDYSGWDDLETTVVQTIIDDPVMQAANTRIIAEPWAPNGFYLGAFPKASNSDHAWLEWNAHYRDWWRSFVNNDSWTMSSKEGSSDGGSTLTGSHDLFGTTGRAPFHSVNFLTVHDGFTLYDLMSYDSKQNGCGPLNPVCCDEPNSAFCDRSSGENNNRSRNWGDEPTKRQMIRNLFMGLLLSHGTPLILGGDEWMRTQLGNNNAYSTQADNPNNWFQWGTYQAADERYRMFDFVKKLIQFRKDHAYALAPSAYGSGAPFAWKNANNTDLSDWNVRHLAMHYYDTTVGPEIEVLINMEGNSVEFQLPDGAPWMREIDSQSWFDDEMYLGMSGEPRTSHNIDAANPVEITEATYTVSARTIVVLTRTP